MSQNQYLTPSPFQQLNMLPAPAIIFHFYEQIMSVYMIDSRKNHKIIEKRQNYRIYLRLLRPIIKLFS